MNILISILVGIIWGALAAFANISITKAAIRKKTDNAVTISSVSRTAVDILALAVVFLMRDLLPLDYRFTLIGTAVSLSLTTIVMSFMLAKKM